MDAVETPALLYRVIVQQEYDQATHESDMWYTFSTMLNLFINLRTPAQKGGMCHLVFGRNAESYEVASPIGPYSLGDCISLLELEPDNGKYILFAGVAAGYLSNVE